MASAEKHEKYHLKGLVWFHGFTASHWVLEFRNGSLIARSSRGGRGAVEVTGHMRHWEEPVTDEMLARIEPAVPGSAPAMMGFDFVICDGEPGTAVLNRPLNFSSFSKKCHKSSGSSH
jgi:hypothetical protein